MNSKKIESVILSLLVVYSVYCSLIIGKSWDEGYHYLQGKAIFQYLLSFGKIRKEYFYEEYYSPSYWFFQFFFSQLFPVKYKVEAAHIFNLLISISSIVGFSKLISELFNKYLGKISFLVLFFYPVFFGHMSFNPKDTVISFCHIWIFYLIIRYFKKQYNKKKSNKYLYFASILFAIGTGVQLLFIGTLIPVLIFILSEVFIFKKIIKKNFSYKLLVIDLLKFLSIFYFFLIFFWPAAHLNIILSPFQIFIKSLDIVRGYEFNLINGQILLSKNITIFYFYINFFFKSPEFIILSYVIFLFFFFYYLNFFIKEFSNFLYKFSFLFLFLFMPILIIKLTSFGIYDGIRLFLWCIPYFCIIPSLTIYFLIKNFKKKIFKFFLYINILLFIYHFFVFIIITPYHYTYLNLFKNFNKNNLERFEGDYWNASIPELVKKIDFSKDKKFNLATCGIHRDHLKEYLNIYQKDNLKKINFVDSKDAKYLLMANRVVDDFGNNNKSLRIDTCFNKYIGYNFISVDRLGRQISVVRIIESNSIK